MRCKTILKDEEYGFAQIESILCHFDDIIDSLSSQVHRLQMVQSFKSNLLKDSTASVNVKLAELTDTIGSKPILLNNLFDAPDMRNRVRTQGRDCQGLFEYD